MAQYTTKEVVDRVVTGKTHENTRVVSQSTVCSIVVSAGETPRRCVIAWHTEISSRKVATNAGTCPVDQLVEEIGGTVRTQVMRGVITLVTERIHARITSIVYCVLIVEATT